MWEVCNFEVSGLYNRLEYKSATSINGRAREVGGLYNACGSVVKRGKNKATTPEKPSHLL